MLLSDTWMVLLRLLGVSGRSHNEETGSIVSFTQKSTLVELLLVCREVVDEGLQLEGR